MFILGVPIDELSKGNQTLPFVIKISDQIVDFPDLFPIFDVFPSSLTYFTSEEKPAAPQTFELLAVCSDPDGEVKSLAVNFVADFIEAQIEGSQVKFNVTLTNEMEIGTTVVEVACTDSAEQVTSEQFAIEVKALAN